MPTKFQFITALYNQTVRSVTSSYKSWTGFLRAACYNYKCPFDEQILIYAQRPNATAVLEMERWNRQFGRWVNRGAKSIAVFGDDGQHLLKLYFDVSDTHESRFSRPLPIWTMQPAFEPTVIETLEATFGNLAEKESLAEAVRSASHNAVADNITDYLQDLLDCREASLLEELDDLNLEVFYRDALEVSVSYMLLTRLGLRADDYFSPDEFGHIYEFNTPTTINALGIATSDIAEMGLREISRTVMQAQREQLFAKDGKTRYDSNTERNLDAERSDEHGNHLSRAERLSNSESAASAGAGSPSGQVRGTAAAVPQAAPPRAVHQPENELPTDSTSGGDRADRAEDGSTDRGADGESRGRNGGVESDRSAALDRSDDQPQTQRGGTVAERPDLRLTTEDPTEAGSNELPAFVDHSGDYVLLDRLRADCEYFLGAGGRSEKHLWAGNVHAQIEKMRELYDALPEKPEWLTEETIDHYAVQMAAPYQVAAYHHFENGFDDKLDYQTLKEAEVAAQGYITGTMEEDGFAYDGAAVYSAETSQCLRIYGDYPDEKAQEQAAAFALEHDATHPDGTELPAFLDMHLIEANLLDDGGRSHKRQEIFAYFQNHKSLAERTEFLKNSYNDIWVEVVTDGIRTGYHAEKNGLLMWEGSYLSRTSESVFSWSIIAEMTEGLIERGGYKIKLGLQNAPVTAEQLALFDMGGDASVYEVPKGEMSNIPKPVKQVSQEITQTTEPEPPQADEPTVILTPPRKKKQNTLAYPLDTNGSNYRITDDHIGEGAPLERFQHNLDAIRTLKTVEAENRTAIPEEQAVLAQYVGWGGLADFFDEKNPRYSELKKLLTDEEYTAARESTLTAFYTPPTVIRGVYAALGQMGFTQGNILEPSCGIGNFLGMLPDEMSESKLYGVELDDLSGRIARQLYQRSSIAVQGFERTAFPDNFFDVAIGNVPFGQFHVPDKRYDRLNFPIHEYFIAKALDEVRPGGVIAFVTSSYTMDKRTASARKYIAQRAELLGAIRLPNNAFKAAAGTEVVSDILFLQKRERMVDIEPEWVHLATNEDGIQMNSYFIDHPDMVLGEMKMVSGPFGPAPTCEPYPEQALDSLLSEAVQNIHGEIIAYDREEELDGDDYSIEADPAVRNFSYTLVDGQIYYRENSRMNPVEVSKTAESRIKGMIELRDCVRTLLEYQTEDYPEAEIKDQQTQLNALYDDFTKKYGLINSRGNAIAFDQDSSYFLLCSLEVLDEDGGLKRKADLFTKRTIRSHKPAEKVDTAVEALALSIGEKAHVDMEYMSRLTGKDEETLCSELSGVVFLNPDYAEGVNEKYLPADEYLSGNVRQKLVIAQSKATQDPRYQINADALTQVQPTDLTASEISVRLGATWLDTEYVRQFIFETLGTPRSAQWSMKVHYSGITGEWRIEGKSKDRGNVKAFNTYGTKRINAYEIIEDTLNLKDVRIFDYVYDADGRKTAVLNKKETAIAQSKQELIKDAFAEWIWKDPNRREAICKTYNILFNSNRPREYDGSHINFSGMNPEITLRKHQVNAIAHILYGGNTLLAHVVGAGKTFEMVAAAMESKRLGLCQKSLFIVPNHLTEQWATEFLQLYPAANILVATKKDFETKNRKKFCGRIATGDYDAVIIGHSQFEKIPMSVERQRAILQQQMQEIMMGIREAKEEKAENFTIKQMEKTKKGLQAKLDKLNDQSRKDDVVTFEELGVDRIFIDESHYFKNLFLYTKMRNVGGIAQTEAQKSSDLFMKCRYLDEITGGRGIIFATGTPISNSMVELYTIQRYLQMNALQEQGLQHFDSWAANYGETVTAIELSPEGTGYRAKTRFAKFFNLPELMSVFKNVADIQTADMLKLPVPEAHHHNIALKPSEYQKKMVEALGERAEKVRNREVDSSVDNMLLITNDGRKLALDQRLVNPMLPSDPDSKAAKCAENVFAIWQRTADQHSTQMIFCDLSTPKGDGSFSVYDDIRDKLLEFGIPENEIAYIHNAKSEAQKKDLFAKVRAGQVRVLLGSTQRMGAGTNCQQKLIALHHLDCPWRPSDLQQREGRIIRQGNENPSVDIYSYVTEGTFDAYLYQLVESKQKFISQIMTSKSPVRSADDVDEQALSYAEIKALASGNPLIKEKMDLDIEVSKLKLLKSNHLNQKYSLEDAISKTFPKQIAETQARIAGYGADIAAIKENTHPNADGFSPLVLAGATYADKKEAGAALLTICQNMLSPEATQIGSYRGLTLELSFDSFSQEYRLTMVGRLRHTVTLGTDVFGNLQRMDNALEALPLKEQTCREQLSNLQTQLETAKVEVQKPFPREEELKAKTARLEELNALLNMDNKEPEPEQDEKVKLKEELER